MTSANSENDPTPPGALSREGTTTDPRRWTLRLEPTMDLAVGLTLALERQRRGLTIEAVAEATGLPQEEVRDHESGSYPLPVSRVGLLCEALGFEPGVLLEAARLGQRHAMIAMTGKAPDEPSPEEDIERPDPPTVAGVRGGGSRGC